MVLADKIANLHFNPCSLFDNFRFWETCVCYPLAKILDWPFLLNKNFSALDEATANELFECV